MEDKLVGGHEGGKCRGFEYLEFGGFVNEWLMDYRIEDFGVRSALKLEQVRWRALFAAGW